MIYINWIEYLNYQFNYLWQNNNQIIQKPVTSCVNQRTCSCAKLWPVVKWLKFSTETISNGLGYALVTLWYPHVSLVMSTHASNTFSYQRVKWLCVRRTVDDTTSKSMNRVLLTWNIHRYICLALRLFLVLTV